MRILTNPASNLSPEVVSRYEVSVTSQTIVVDGVDHDGRDRDDFDTLDGWVRGAREHPYVLGTSASEFAKHFDEAAREDPELLAVTTSRKIIQSHAAAEVAARIVRDRPGHEGVRIAVADSGSTDVGTALAVILAGEARRAGLSLEETAALMEAYRVQSRSAFTVETLDYLVKGGRAGSLRAFLANLLKVRPIITFVDGELTASGRMSASDDPAAHLADTLAGAVGGERPQVWAATFHGGAPEKARRLAECLRERFEVAFLYTRPLSSSVYLHAGRGSVGAAVVPLAGLPWTPPVPTGI